MDINTHLSDEELLSLLKSGDEIAFNIIFKRHWKSLYNEVFKRLRDPMQSEEVVQDVFLNLWIKKDMQKIENLAAYLHASVKYQVFMLYRKVKLLPKFEEPLDFLDTSGLQADAQFFAKELRGLIEAWLEMQPEKRREIFRLRYIEEYSTKEISEQLNISQKTVQNTIGIGLVSLRDCLGLTLTATIIVIACFEASKF